METQPLQSSTTAPRQNYTSAKRLWLLLIPMAFTIPIIALMGYVLANREPATCEAYVSLCKDNPGETGLMDDSLTFVLSSAGLSLVAVVVGLSLGSCCKCDGLRCCHCGNVYALGSVFAQVASWIVLLAALVWMGTLALFLTLCQCPPKIAQVIRDPTIILEEGKEVQVDLDNPLDGENLKQVCIQWDGNDLGDFVDRASDQYFLFFCAAPTNEFVSESLGLAILAVILSASFLLFTILSRRVEEKRLNELRSQFARIGWGHPVYYPQHPPHANQPTAFYHYYSDPPQPPQYPPSGPFGYR